MFEGLGLQGLGYRSQKTILTIFLGTPLGRASITTLLDIYGNAGALIGIGWVYSV